MILPLQVKQETMATTIYELKGDDSDYDHSLLTKDTIAALNKTGQEFYLSSFELVDNQILFTFKNSKRGL